MRPTLVGKTDDLGERVVERPVPVADLSVTKTDGAAQYTPGDTLSYEIVVSNAGPSSVVGATR